MARQTSGSAAKRPVSCPNITKLSNNSVGSVDIIHKKTAACRLECKKNYCFYLGIFFDLIDVTLVNSHIVYTKLDMTYHNRISKLL